MGYGKHKDNPGLIYRGYQYHIHPTEEQIEFFSKSFGCCRFVWNQLLAQYRESGKLNTPASLKKDNPFLKEVDSLALANVQMNLNKAIRDHKNNPRHFGFPAFKSKHHSQKTYTTNRNKAVDNIYVQDGLLYLPKIKSGIPIVLHRPIPENAVIKTATIRQSAAGDYSVTLKLEFEKQEHQSAGNKVIGLDMAMQKLYVDSEGNTANYPCFYRLSQSKLAREQRKLSRMKKGSNNFLKQKKKIARLHEKIANQRKDFLHKKALYLAETYDAVMIEDLNMQAMAGFGHLGKSVSDNGWGLFVFMLEYKLEDREKKLVRIDKWFPSSQKCSQCGHIHKETKDLSVREWICPECHTVHHRDVNAAINIRNEGVRQITA